jgi:predicted metallopeptidase
MADTRTCGPARPLPLELRWDDRSPLPTRWVLPDGARPDLPPPPASAGFDFTGRMRALCADVVARCEELRHVQMPRVLVTFTPSRNRSRYGLQARVTPLRFRGGALSRRHGSTEYRVQRYFVNGGEMFYVLTFCLPRFLDQSFREKLVTVFHELYHIGPAFDGDLRRHPGRCAIHSHSKSAYDDRMEELVRAYLSDHPDPAAFRFLRSGYRELWDTHGGVTGVVVPRPKLLPVGSAVARAARSRADEGV